MSRTVDTMDGFPVRVQGARPGGGIEFPYVVILADDVDYGSVGYMLSLEAANTLAEFIRQEAEFAGSAREEENTNGI